jgi:hypothetical protein
MLRRWLEPLEVDGFLRTHLGALPYARPGSAVGAVPLFDWHVLDAVLAARPFPDVLVANAGRLADVAQPRHVSDVRALMKAGLGVVIRRAECHDAQLAQLARAFADDLPGTVHVQLYVTPAGTQTFGWHFDQEHVFVVQTQGTKDYYFRENTVTQGELAGDPDFSAIRGETSPMFSARLLPGDWLYIPARWWHLVRSVEDALSISIGVVPSEETCSHALGGSR